MQQQHDVFSPITIPKPYKRYDCRLQQLNIAFKTNLNKLTSGKECVEDGEPSTVKVKIITTKRIIMK